jgi:hypothetical protein
MEIKIILFNLNENSHLTFVATVIEESDVQMLISIKIRNKFNKNKILIDKNMVNKFHTVTDQRLFILLQCKATKSNLDTCFFFLLISL